MANQAIRLRSLRKASVLASREILKVLRFLLHSERGMSFEKTFRRQVWHGPRLRGKLGEQSNNFSLEKLKAGF